MFLEGILWAGFGLIFGSFANVLIARQGTEKTLGGRSACPKCQKTLLWYELVPVLSFLVLRGRCSGCHTRISIQYPIVEILVALGFVAIGFSSLPLFARLIGCGIVVLLIAIAIYDLYEMIMPDAWVWSFNILALISSLYVLVSPGLWQVLPVLIAGPLVALPLFCMWFFSRGAWMGFGDVKFALGMGWLLSAPFGYLALMYAFMIGAIVGVGILLPLENINSLLQKVGITRLGRGNSGFTMKSEVPFGPFLIAATFLVWISALYFFEPILDFFVVSALWN